MGAILQEPKRIWWARPRKLCALERPGGGGRTHRRERRAAEIGYLVSRGVRLVVSTVATRQNLAAYEEAGLGWHHVPVPVTEQGGAALEELLRLLRSEVGPPGAVAIHGDLRTDFVAAVCAAYLHSERGLSLVVGLTRAADAGLMVTSEACSLVGVDVARVERERELRALAR